MRRLTALIAAIVLSIGLVGPASAHWPVHAPRDYVSQWFSRSRHQGIDIAAPSGANVYAALKGYVSFAGWKYNCGGWQVIVRHRGGWYSTYNHLLDRPDVRAGQRVHAGVKIGDVGRSGKPPKGQRMVCATGNHLHFELWRGYPWRSGSYRVNGWYLIDHGYYLPSRYR